MDLSSWLSRLWNRDKPIPQRLLPYQKVLTFKYKQKTPLKSKILRTGLHLHSASKFTWVYTQVMDLQKYLRQGLLIESISRQAKHSPAAVAVIAPWCPKGCPMSQLAAPSRTSLLDVLWTELSHKIQLRWDTSWPGIQSIAVGYHWKAVIRNTLKFKWNTTY